MQEIGMLPWRLGQRLGKRFGDMASYTPRRGDVVWLTFDPQAGHEQSGRRPAFVISLYAYNQKVGLFIVCPITSQVKGYPFEVPISTKSGIRGVVLADQIKSLDWRARKAEFVEAAATDMVEGVLARILPLIDDAP
jgi:mRNA interferase MazF